MYLKVEQRVLRLRENVGTTFHKKRFKLGLNEFLYISRRLVNYMVETIIRKVETVLKLFTN